MAIVDLMEGEASNEKSLSPDVVTALAATRTEDDDLAITATVDGKEEESDASVYKTEDTLCADRVAEITDDVEVKKEEVEQQLPMWGKSKRFTVEEDRFLKAGLEKYGKGNWSRILSDTAYRFHPARTRDSLRMRAETCAFKIRKHVK